MRNMPAKTSPIPYPSSSQQQTPALDYSRFRNDASASSSSPIPDVLTTPKDGDRFMDSNVTRGRQAKGTRKAEVATRRTSVRVRAPSSTGIESSPNEGLMESIQPEAAPLVAPALSRHASSSRIPSRSKTRAAGPSSSRQSATPSSSTLAIAQANGITKDQYEQARQEVMRFLRTDEPAQHQQAEKPTTRSKQAVVPAPLTRSSGRSLSVTPTPALASNAGEDAYGLTRDVLGSPAPISRTASPAVPATPTAPSISESSHGDADPSSSKIPLNEHATPGPATREALKEVRTRPSLEEMVARSAERENMRKEREVRMWAEQGGEESSSSDDAVTQDDRINMTPRSRTAADLARGPLPSIASLLPSPSFEAHSPFQQSSFQQPTAARGMMERFLSDRDGKEGHSPEPHGLRSPHYSAVDRKALRDLEESPRLPPINSYHAHTPNPLSSPLSAPRLHSTVSPPAKSLPFSPNAMMTSPAPSRPNPFFSPDVANLLRSELDELNSSARKSPTQKRSREDDIHVSDADEFSSSPFRRSGYDGSPTITPNGVKRHRDIFGSTGNDSGKRSRWSDHSDDRRPSSPSPSTTSMSLRAPSFCDSSPALSERASTVGGGVRPPYPLATHHHPASAPDFSYHHGLPSSSPASSQTSYSDYAPPGQRHRSSPGPAPIASTSTSTPILARASSSSNVIDAARKRAPMKRADTSPALLGPDGYAKPGWSYAALIGQAIFSTETRKISLADIYTFIMTCYPYYKKEDSGWQNSIRHNLSLNECFIKTARGADNPGKGCLWAISPGCEEQFADGGFTKKGATAQGKKGKARTPMLAGKFDPNGLFRSSSSSKRGRDDSPASSSRDASPAPSMTSSREASRLPSTMAQADTASVRSEEPLDPSPSPPPPPPPRVEVRQASGGPGERNVAAVLRRRESNNAMNASSSNSSPAPAPTPTSTPAIAAASVVSTRAPTPVQRAESAPAPAQEEPPEKKPKLETLAPPYIPRQTPSTTSATGSLRQNQSSSRRHAFTSPAAASPPTSVYHRLAAPYQPANYSQTSAQNHRALALLASPEPSGIMPVHPSVYDRPPSLPSSSPERPPHLQSHHHHHFLPAPQIFPGSARRHRADSEEKEMKPPQSMLSPTAMVHSQSPVSSLRGGPRAPMSPVQTSSEESAEEERGTDPEKKRAHGLRHIPAVAALAGDSSHDTFPSPPRHLRSPSSRSLQSVGALQAAMATPGSRRPWGTPGRFGASPGMGDSTWGWGDPFSSSVEAELERFGREEAVNGSGASSMGPRLYWPSPSAPSSGTMAW